MFSRWNNDRKDLVIVNRTTGKPEKDVSIGVFSRKDKTNNQVLLSTLLTDENGLASLAKGYNNSILKIMGNGDTLIKSVEQEYNSDIEKREAEIKTFLFTDRSIYRPGQKVFFKGIVFRNNVDGTSTVLKGKTREVRLHDASYQVIKTIELKTNEFGTFSGEFVIPVGCLNGVWVLHTLNCNLTIRVEEYKRPQFDVRIDPQKKNILLNDTVTVTGSALTYSGAPITNVPVKYSVSRSRDFNYWYIRGTSYDNTEIISGKAATDEYGHFVFQFTAVPGAFAEDSDIIYKYSVNVSVTDATGETQSSADHIMVGSHELFLNSDIPDIISLEDNNNFSISAVNSNMQPAVANVNAAIYRLEVPSDVLLQRPWGKPDTELSLGPDDGWKVLSEGERYIDELPITGWKRVDTVFNKTIRVTGNSVLSLNEIKGMGPGKYILVLTSECKTGDVKFEKFFDLYSPTDNQLPENQPFWAKVLTPAVKSGSQARIVVGTGLNEQHVLYEVENNEGIYIRKWVKLKKGKTLLNLPVGDWTAGEPVLHFTAVYKNQFYSFIQRISIEKPQVRLKTTFESFRNKTQPGSKELWKISVKMPDCLPAKAELLVGMYDMSLDAFENHSWNFKHASNLSYRAIWETYNAANVFSAIEINNMQWVIYDMSVYAFPDINRFGFSLYYEYSPGDILKGVDHIKKTYIKFLPPVVKADEMEVEELHSIENVVGHQSGIDYSLIEVKEEVGETELITEGSSRGKTDSGNKDNFLIRKNLQETAFFFPHLVTDTNGVVAFSFTAPEALTRWKVMTFAHTKELLYDLTERTLVTQKDLMIQANAPRFLREGDTLYFTARVSNLTNSQISGIANLRLFNARNNVPIDTLFGNDKQQSFQLNKMESKALSWKLIVPYGDVQAVTWQASASSDSCSDGEEGRVPVLTNTILVTESMPIEINGHEKKDYVFNRLENYTSSTLKQHGLTFEYTSNPLWFAIQALPYLIEFPHECAEQTFSRYFANTLSSYLVNSDPRISKVLDRWRKNGGNSPETNLTEYPDLKSIILQENPWLLEAQEDAIAKRRLALLFDMTKLAAEKTAIENKLKNLMNIDGGWPWFKDMPTDCYITQHIVAGLGHLKKLSLIDIKNNRNLKLIVNRALEYCDYNMNESYKQLMKDWNKNLKYSVDKNTIQYLYARSFYSDVPLNKEDSKAFNFWQKLAYDQWQSQSKCLQGMIALSAFRSGNKALAQTIIASLKENSIVSDEMGMYFKQNSNWYWYEAPIEMQSLMIEAFDEINHDTASVDLMRKWLLKNKQTSNWGTTRATAEACYALLLRGANWIDEEKMPVVTIGNENIDVAADIAEAEAGYIKTSRKGVDINPQMAKLHVENNNLSPAWGGLYWQYFEQLDKVTSGSTQLAIKKHVFLEIEDKYGKKLISVDENTPLKRGDLLKIRIELKVDRSMEYVHMKDMRASGLEPVNVISQSKWQDGVDYYESTKDAATNFFIQHLKKGTYVFEYPLRVQYSGNFSNGITTVQCMYAPEFTSHSEGIRLKVE